MPHIMEKISIHIFSIGNHNKYIHISKKDETYSFQYYRSEAIWQSIPGKDLRALFHI